MTDKNQLSPEEIEELRAIIENDKRVKWLWATVRNVSIWIVGVVTATTVGYQAFVDVVRGAIDK